MSRLQQPYLKKLTAQIMLKLYILNSFFITFLDNSNRALQKFAHGPIVDNDVAAANESNANEIRKLQDELNTLTKRNQGKKFAKFVKNLLHGNQILSGPSHNLSNCVYPASRIVMNLVF